MIAETERVPTGVLEDLHRVCWMLRREGTPLSADQIAAARRWTDKYTQQVLSAGLRQGDLLQMLPDGRVTLLISPLAC